MAVNSCPDLDDFMTIKALWWYKHIFDTDGNGILTHKDYMRSAQKYAILHCKGDRIQSKWNKVFDSFNGIWAEIKGKPAENDGDKLLFIEWKDFVLRMATIVKKFDDFSKPIQTLIDLLFDSYDAYNDHVVDENEYRLYLCARNMDVKRAQECFAFMISGQKVAKLNRQQFQNLMVDYLISWDTNSKGKYICGPYDTAKRPLLDKYYRSTKG